MWVKFYAFPQCAVKGLKVKNGMGKLLYYVFQCQLFIQLTKKYVPLAG
jgi:hypothetical protein